MFSFRMPSGCVIWKAKVSHHTLNCLCITYIWPLLDFPSHIVKYLVINLILADLTVSKLRPHEVTNGYSVIRVIVTGFIPSVKSSIEKVFGNSLNKVRCWHEDPNSAEDSEEWESHETKPVDNRCSKFPLVAHSLVFVLFPKAFGNIAHLVQDLGQLWFHAAHWGAVTCGEEHLVLACSSDQSSAEDTRVERGGSCGVLNALQATDANIKHVAVGGLGGWDTRIELHAGQAAPRSFVVTGWTHSVLTWALHAQKPGAPVQQDHTGLWDQTIMNKK